MTILVFHFLSKLIINIFTAITAVNLPQPLKLSFRFPPLQGYFGAQCSA